MVDFALLSRRPCNEGSFSSAWLMIPNQLLALCQHLLNQRSCLCQIIYAQKSIWRFWSKGKSSRAWARLSTPFLSIFSHLSSWEKIGSFYYSEKFKLRLCNKLSLFKPLLSIWSPVLSISLFQFPIRGLIQKLSQWYLDIYPIKARLRPCNQVNLLKHLFRLPSPVLVIRRNLLRNERFWR